MANWTHLPVDILVVIAQSLTVIEDFNSFTAVCKEWKSMTSILKKKPSLPTRYPRIMLADKMDTDDQDASIIRCFLNLLTSKTYRCILPEASGRKCGGAHYGWLWTIGSDLQISLLHPFSRRQICLPPMLTFPDQYEYDEAFKPQEVWDFFVRKIAMSTNPLKEKSLHDDDYNEDCTIAAIYGEFAVLAFTKLGDTFWTNISVHSRVYQDIIFYNGKFYAVDAHGVVVVCDLDDACGPKAIVIAPAPFETSDTYQKYLVESSGNLLLVSRIRKGLLFGDDDTDDDDDDDDDECDDFDNEEDEGGIDSNEDVADRDSDIEEEKKSRYYTIGFSVLRLDECHEEGKKYAYRLTEVTTLGDEALFIGSNVSTSIASSEIECIKRNCIYFTDDNFELYFEEPGGGGHDTGIFNMEDGTIQLNYAGESCSNISPPLWYI